MASISSNSSMVSNRSSSPPAKTSNGASTLTSTASMRSASAFSFYSNPSPAGNKKKNSKPISNQNSAASLKANDMDDNNESMSGYLDQVSQLNSTTSPSPSPLLLPLTTKFKSQRILNTNAPQYQSTLKEIKTIKNQAPTKETLRRVAQEIKDKKIISKLAQLHLDVVEHRRKEAKEQGVTFSEFGATGKIATDDDGNDETLEFIEQVVKRLSEHLEYTKVELFKKVDVITTTDEDVFVDNFKKNVVDKLEKKNNSNNIIKTDEEIQRFFDERINLVFKFWQQEFVLRLKSSLQLKKENESNKENHDSNLIGIDKYRKLQVENKVLNSLVEKRDKMLEGQRTEYFKEILCLKEELTKLNYQYVPPSYFPENFDAVLTLSFLEDENIKELNQILLQTKNSLNERENDIRNLMNSINIFQADTFEKLKKHSQSNVIEKLMETAKAFKFKAQRLFGDNNIPNDQYQSLFEKAIQLEKENEKIKNELSFLQNIQKSQAILAMEEVHSNTATSTPVSAAATHTGASLNKSGSTSERSRIHADYEDDDDTLSVTSSIATSITNCTTIHTPNNGEEVSNPIVSQLAKQLRSKEKRIAKLSALLDEAQEKIKDFEDPEKIKESIMKPLRKYKAYRELIVALETETFILQKELDKTLIREDDLIRTRNNLMFKVEDLSSRLRDLSEWRKEEYQRNHIDKKQEYLCEIERLKKGMAEKDDLLTSQESHIQDLSNDNIKLNSEITKLLSKISFLRSEIKDLESHLEEKMLELKKPINNQLEITRMESIVEEKPIPSSPLLVPPPPILSRSDSGVQTDFPKTVVMSTEELDIELNTSNNSTTITPADQTTKKKQRKSKSPIKKSTTSNNNNTSTTSNTDKNLKGNTNLNAIKKLKTEDKSTTSSHNSSITTNISSSEYESDGTISQQEIPSPICFEKENQPSLDDSPLLENQPISQQTTTTMVEIDEDDPDYDFNTFKTKLQKEEARKKEEQKEKKETETKKSNNHVTTNTTTNTTNTTNTNTTTTDRTLSRSNSKTGSSRTIVNSRTSSRNSISRSSSTTPTTFSQQSPPPLTESVTITPPTVEKVQVNETMSELSPTTILPNNEENSVLLDDQSNDEKNFIQALERASSPEKRIRLASLEYTRGDNDLQQIVQQARRKSIEAIEAATVEKLTQETPVMNENESAIVEENIDESPSESPKSDENTQMVRPERRSVRFSPMLDDNNVDIHTIRPKKRLGTMTLIERLLVSQEGKELREHGYNDYYYDDYGNLVLKKGSDRNQNSNNNGDHLDGNSTDGNSNDETIVVNRKSTKPSTKLSIVISKNRKTTTDLKNNYKINNYKMDDEEITEELIRNMDSTHPLYRNFYDENGNLICDFNNLLLKLNNNNPNSNNNTGNDNSRLSPTWNTGSFNGRNNAHGFSTNLAKRNRGNSRLSNSDSDDMLYIGKNLTLDSNQQTTIHTKTLLSDGSTRNYHHGSTRRLNGNSNSTNHNSRLNSHEGSPNHHHSLTSLTSLTITTPTLFKSLGHHIELSKDSKQKRLKVLMEEEQERLEKVLTSWNQMSRGHPDSINKMKEELLQQLEEEENSHYYDIKQHIRTLSPSKKEYIIEREFNTVRYTPQNVVSELLELSSSNNNDSSKVELDDEENYDNITDYLMRPLLKIKGFSNPTTPTNNTTNNTINNTNTNNTLKKSSQNSVGGGGTAADQSSMDDSLLYDINVLGQLDKQQHSNNYTTTMNMTSSTSSGINLINIHHERNNNTQSNSSSTTPTVSPNNAVQHLISAPVIPKFGVKGRKPSTPTSIDQTHVHRIPSIVHTQRSKSVATCIVDEKPRPSTTATPKRVNKLSGYRSESAMDTLEHVKKSIKR